MNVGKLYQIKKYIWLLYPSKKIAADVKHAVVTHEADLAVLRAEALAAHYSEKYNCNVSFISPNSIFVILQQDEKFIKVLSTNGEIGWFYLADWCKNDIEEVNQ